MASPSSRGTILKWLFLDFVIVHKGVNAIRNFPGIVLQLHRYWSARIHALAFLLPSRINLAIEFVFDTARR